MVRGSGDPVGGWVGGDGGSGVMGSRGWVGVVGVLYPPTT